MTWLAAWCTADLAVFYCVQGFPLRLAPGAPHSLRLLAGHPFSQQQASEEEQDELAQQLMTQLAPEQQLVAAQIMSGEQLPAFKVRTSIFTSAWRSKHRLEITFTAGAAAAT